MNKTELVTAIAENAGITKADASRALQALIETVTTAMSNGDSVSLTGFGTFTVAERAARTGRNPSNGKALKIAAKKVAKFKAGKGLSQAVN
ncbi:MAG: HU family DNA-binding protein [Proteobacteria bacterium]|nr:HU family DNA-binding protein [Desulfobulbaceae bacterium]MBU4154232.1 HU family DNA-binding protein [Pseudomonadota bacterium]